MTETLKTLGKGIIIGTVLCTIIAGGYLAFFFHQPEVMSFELKKPFKHEQGYCWSVSLPEFAKWADSQSQPENSALLIYEDGSRLGPGHSYHESIRKIGGGRFSHWGETLYFSTADNSDPNQNGRQYTVKVSALSSYLPVARKVIYVLLVLVLTGGVAGFLFMRVFSNQKQIKKWLLIAAAINFIVIIYLYINIASPLTWYGKTSHILIFLFLLSSFASCFLIFSEVIGQSGLTGGDKVSFTFITMWSALGIFVLMVEVFFRIFPIYDTLALNPGIKFFWPDYVNYPLNSMGYRDRPFVVKKTPDTYRIIVVGDSFVEGSGCRREETFLGRLEQELNRRLESAGCPKKVEVYNLGRCGANTVEEVQIILQEGPILEPDLIILAYVLNDPEIHPPDLKTFKPPPLVSAIHKIFLEDIHSYAYYWFFTKFTVFQGEISSWEEYCLAIHNPDYHGWRKAGEAFSNLRENLSRNHWEFFAIIFPKFHQEEYDQKFREIHQQVNNKLKENNLEVVDLLEFYEGINKNLTVFAFSPYDQHPNLMAHNVLGEYLAGLVWDRKSFNDFRKSCITSK